MTVAWISYGLIASVLIGVAASAIERGTQLLRRSVRWIWCAAIGLAALAVAAVPFRIINTYTVELVTSAPTFIIGAVGPRATSLTQTPKAESSWERMRRARSTQWVR